ncbi:MAG: 3-dehydroquinate synthase [Bacteroidetes Order II. Incertae sedis bacterium]|jgi:3-dehydroquinate synthase|nr:3-dehydroquinate synthase [Bacteroidetes Order II. bacterium]MBT4053332.1 3-dehydroquinate synthase [Bacteroidetes Order II. bacterium]MBT5250308.1 3-dehydroquinate synthase [Bacteroidetes Order II. bacterium]MBT6201931.1 3-dehydroquinate synthase [Bacteroidetes Order II. bacterium]MBT6424783.1 3-dehydroquinate synthase [Bacteroidetes Order II. bacterium]
MLFQDKDKPVQVSLSEGRSYELAFGPLSELPLKMREAGLRPGKCVVVTDTNVAGHYRATLDAILQYDGWDPLILTLPAGEETKSPKPLQAIYDAALAWNIDRQTPVLALGGGVIGDLAGFAASSILRGVPFVQIPTSLIAQVDSSIGGKTGINHDEGKNLIGAFYQPRLVLIDTKLLYTLPRREWSSGLAEIIKHALIQDEPFFAWMESTMPQILARDPAVIDDLVYRAAAIKAEVVSEDEFERGRRAILNYGHTFGHALEKVLGYGVLTHGEAVTVGMRAALFMSRRFSRKIDQERVDRILLQIPIPPIPATISIANVREAMASDKKRESDRLRFVLLKKIGQAYVTDDVTVSDVDAAWAFALGRT